MKRVPASMPTYMIAIYLSRWVSGEASITQSLLASLSLLAIWSLISLFLLTYIGPLFVTSHFVILVNVLLFIWGACASYSASITSHAITMSFTSRGTKFLARFCNFILLFAGIVMIILITSGEVSWLTYLSLGIHSGLR